jgi:hypothetical protein
MQYGLNVRAFYDSDCRFLYFGVMAAGKFPDQKAFLFERTKLLLTIFNLCPGQLIWNLLMQCSMHDAPNA